MLHRDVFAEKEIRERVGPSWSWSQDFPSTTENPVRLQIKHDIRNKEMDQDF